MVLHKEVDPLTTSCANDETAPVLTDAESSLGLALIGELGGIDAVDPRFYQLLHIEAVNICELSTESAGMNFGDAIRELKQVITASDAPTLESQSSDEDCDDMSQVA